MTRRINVWSDVLSGAIFFTLVAGALPAAAADPKAKTDADAKKKVYEQKIGDAYVSAQFGVNRNLGRAWVEVAASPVEVPSQRDIVARQMIKGLYYDPDRKAVIYQHKGQETVCAEDWRFLLATSLKITGNCELKVAMKERKLDDGSTVQNEPVTTVTLVAHNLKPAQRAKASMGVVEMIVIAPDES